MVEPKKESLEQVGDRRVALLDEAVTAAATLRSVLDELRRLEQPEHVRGRQDALAEEFYRSFAVVRAVLAALDSQQPKIAESD